MALPDDIRAARRAGRDAGRARSACVASADRRLRGDAARPDRRPRRTWRPGRPTEARAAFSLQLNAVNFGSGWFPTLRKPPGRSGFRTIEAGLRARGPWTRAELRALDAGAVAEAFGQDPGHALMAQFATALNELGAVAGDDGSSSRWPGAATARRWRSPSGSPRLPTWADTSPYDGAAVPFFKRAQLAAADLHLQGLAPAADLARLTLFADNLVPHVLRIDGVLRLRPVARRADRPPASCSSTMRPRRSRSAPARCTPSSCSSRRTARRRRPRSTTSLWHRGAGPRYKAHPRHRARTTAY